MALIARKLPSEAKPRMVNCDLGHSLFMAEGRIKFFCCCGEKIRLCRTRSVREIRTFGPQYKKIKFLVRIMFNDLRGTHDFSNTLALCARISEYSDNNIWMTIICIMVQIWFIISLWQLCTFLGACRDGPLFNFPRIFIYPSLARIIPRDFSTRRVM